mgnify:CR=1 FL=1
MHESRPALLSGSSVHFSGRARCAGRTSLWLAICLAVGLTFPAGAAVQTPVLKWQRGGCYASWCETGWYSSPAVADLDGDGTAEVIAATYSVFVLNGEDGSVQWSVDPAGGRAWPGVVVADLEGDGDLEIVTAHGSGYLHVFTHTLASAWSRQPTTSELRGLSVEDLDGDGSLEIAVTAAIGSQTNTWVYDAAGTLQTGWPQLTGTSGYAAGVYNDNAALGDFDGDGLAEILVPSDVHYICAYKPDGTHIAANAAYGAKKWGAVGVWESLATELRGWGECSGDRAERYRTNFADGVAVIRDLDGDGASEVAVTGKTYDCELGDPDGTKYMGLFLFHPDRSRFQAGPYDWQTVPVDTGAPLSYDYNVIESVAPNPAAADLDGDGAKEIVFSSFDGRVHAFWLDRTEHGNWPYSVYNASDGFYRFASEPVVADLDDDGHAEVIVASWVQKGTSATGRLHILSHEGTALQTVALPAAFGGPDWNGVLPAPTLADIDGDGELEAILNSAHSGVLAYDLPGTTHARVLWRTGRGCYLRNGQGTLGGDLDDNGYLAAPDLTTLLCHLNGLVIPAKPPFKAPRSAGDLDLDGQVSETDLTRLARHLAGN